MKTKKEYLFDLELDKDLPLIEIKKQYRKLVKIYNSDNGTKKNNDKYRVIIEAYDAILNENYEKEEESLPPLTSEMAVGYYNKALFDLLENVAFHIDVKKNDNLIVNVDNNLINFDVSNLKRDKFIRINKMTILKFCKENNERI